MSILVKEYNKYNKLYYLDIEVEDELEEISLSDFDGGFFDYIILDQHYEEYDYDNEMWLGEGFDDSQFSYNICFLSLIRDGIRDEIDQQENNIEEELEEDDDNYYKPKVPIEFVKEIKELIDDCIVDTSNGYMKEKWLNYEYEGDGFNSGYLEEIIDLVEWVNEYYNTPEISEKFKDCVDYITFKNLLDNLDKLKDYYKRTLQYEKEGKLE